QTFAGIDQVFIRTLGGSDTVKYLLSPHTGGINYAHLHVDLGAGHDLFSLDSNAKAVAPMFDVAINGGEGNDMISIDATNIAEMNDFHIDAGQGNDVVEIRNDDFVGLSNPVNALKLN